MFGKAPYKTVLVNGMVRGADGRMMHKSFGNYVEATTAVGKYGADSVRQWAASGGSTGYDIPFKWSELEHGKKFLTKLWNASRFIMDHLQEYEASNEALELEPLDRWILSKLERTVQSVTGAFEDFQFNIALESIRNFTWHVLCDHYLEAVKYRLYTEDASEAQSKRAAQACLHRCLDVILRLLAPICPHIAETIFMTLYARRGSAQSIHVGPWPASDPSLIDERAERIGDSLSAVIASVRRIKSEKHVSLKTPLKSLVVYADASILDGIEKGLSAVKRVCHVQDVTVASLDEAMNATGYPDLPQVKVKAEFPA